jgi:predicted N-formylglutamate amidohydrolase
LTHNAGITNEDESVAKPFVDKMGAKMDYHVAIDSDGSANATLMQHYNARGIPTAFLVGRNGQVKW